MAVRRIYYQDAAPPPIADSPVVPWRFGNTEATPGDSMAATRIWLIIGIALLLLVMIAAGAGLIQFPDVGVRAG